MGLRADIIRRLRQQNGGSNATIDQGEDEKALRSEQENVEGVRENAIHRANPAKRVGSIPVRMGRPDAHAGDRLVVRDDDQGAQEHQELAHLPASASYAPDGRLISAGATRTQSVRLAPGDTPVSELEESDGDFETETRGFRGGPDGAFSDFGRRDGGGEPEELSPEEIELRAREQAIRIKERELAAKEAEMAVQAKEEELMLRKGQRAIGLSLAQPSVKLALSLNIISDEIDRRVRSNISNMTVRDMKGMAEMTVSVAAKTSQILRTAFDMEREVRGSSRAIGEESFGSPEEALEALEELARTVERYGEDGVVVEDEFPGTPDSETGFSEAENSERGDLE